MIDSVKRPGYGYLIAVFAALASMAGVSLLDSLFFSHELSSFVFYGIPVAIAAWGMGRWESIAAAFVAVVLWFLVHPVPEEASHTLIPYWNAVPRLAFFLVIAFWVQGLRKRHDHLVRSANLDELTGAANVRHFYRLLDEELERFGRSRRPFSLAYFDLDNFKQVNDTEGHPAGDEVLRQVARTIDSITRSIDRLGRLGGDEFALILPETDGPGARACLEKVQQDFHQAMARMDWVVSMSVGVVTCDMTVEAKELIRISDTLMYEAKRAGKGCAVHALVSERRKGGDS